MKNKKTLSRLVAVQILFQFDFNQRSENIEKLTNNLISEYFLSQDQEHAEDFSSKINHDFLSNLVNGVIMIIDELDKKISKNLKGNRKIAELPNEMLQILRLAIFELQYNNDMPKKAVISEYVDITASFFDAKKTSFVNGILQTISDSL